MELRSKIASAAGALALAAAAFYAPAASADRVGFNVTFGGPGYAVNVGNGYGYYDYWQPAPVVVAPYAPYAPYAYYGRPYYRPYVVSTPYPVYRPYSGHRHYRDGHQSHRHSRPVGHVYHR